MDKPDETRPLVLPHISKFDRDWLHRGGDPSQVYTVDELEIYLAIKAREEKERAEK